MEIKSLGHASFKIRGKTATVVTDPFDPSMVGLTWPQDLTADMVTVSHEHEDHNYVSGVRYQLSGKELVIVRGPGEYEVAGVKIYGFSSFHDEKQGAERGRNTIYLIKIDGVNIVHCGDLGHKLTDELIEELETVDVLMIPTGGVYTLDAKKAVEVIHQLEPSLVLPMHYRREGMAAAFAQLSPIEEFLKEIGKSPEPQKKLVFTKEKLPEEMEIVVFN